MADQSPQQSLSRKEVEELLSEQTTAILSALDEKTSKQDVKVSDVQEQVGMMRGEMVHMEQRINEKIERLTTTLDKFLKRMTDMEDEFTIMKHDLNRLKKVIKERLGVDPDATA